MEQLLFPCRDPAYQAFQRRLLPTVDPETILGIPTPELRRIAAALPDPDGFRKTLPHRYFEENQIHAFSLEREKDFELVIEQVERFLPYIDNWATCDQLRPKVFAKHRQSLLPHIMSWLASPQEYTVRFAVEMLMVHYLDEDFCPEYLDWVAHIHREEYYIRMMVAWYFATALAKQPGIAYPYLESRCLEPWVHNKAIQKAVESYRISREMKEQLKQLRIKSAP